MKNHVLLPNSTDMLQKSPSKKKQKKTKQNKTKQTYLFWCEFLGSKMNL